MNFSFALLFAVTVSGFINAVHGDTLKVLFNNGPDLYCGSNCCTPTEWDFIRQQADGVKRRQLRGSNDIEEENAVEIITNDRELFNMTKAFSPLEEQAASTSFSADCARICRGYVSGSCPKYPCMGYRNRMLASDRDLACPKRMIAFQNLVDNILATSTQLGTDCKALMKEPLEMNCVSTQ